MKYDNYSQYAPYRVALAESAFLTVWAGLGRWHDDLVLVGGLVPKYLCGDLSETRTLPRPSTLDVDLGIALAADGNQYGSIFWDLSAQGFSPDQEHPSRFVSTVNGINVPIDFLVERRPATTGTVQIGDLSASIMPGVDRALALARNVSIAGVDLHGAQQNLIARVCEVGPFLALKLRAFHHRQQPKDAFDILYTVRHYDGGTDAAIEAFAIEARAGNPACADALNTLCQHFITEEQPGPTKASHFVLGPVLPSESPDAKYQRATIRQDMVDVAARLLKAATA